MFQVIRNWVRQNYTPIPPPKGFWLVVPLIFWIINQLQILCSISWLCVNYNWMYMCILHFWLLQSFSSAGDKCRKQVKTIEKQSSFTNTSESSIHANHLVWMHQCIFILWIVLYSVLHYLVSKAWCVYKITMTVLFKNSRSGCT